MAQRKMLSNVTWQQEQGIWSNMAPRKMYWGISCNMAPRNIVHYGKLHGRMHCVDLEYAYR